MFWKEFIPRTLHRALQRLSPLGGGVQVWLAASITLLMETIGLQPQQNHATICPGECALYRPWNYQNICLKCYFLLFLSDVGRGARSFWGEKAKERSPGSVASSDRDRPAAALA